MHENVHYIRQFPEPGCFDHSAELWNSRFQDSFVVVNCFSKKIYYPKHWTPFSIKCAFGGKEHYRFNDKSYSVYGDAFLLLNEGNEYASSIEADDIQVESLSLNYSRHSLQLFTAAYSSRPDSLLDDDPLNYTGQPLNYFDKLYRYTPRLLHYINLFRQQLQQEVVDKNILNELAYLSLEELAKIQSETCKEIDQVAAKKRSTREELFKRLHLARDYMYSCYQEPITLDTLASICYLNPCYLLREFKRLFGITPHQYLTAIRLENARQQLGDTQKSMTEILSESGFSDLSSFSKLFKRSYLASPSHFRMAADRKN